ncbi:hypothetical protein SDC9_66928 [bioreactor metagenome]
MYNFIDGSNSSTEYVYDSNGNVIVDSNKGLCSVVYNRNNLPEHMQFSYGHTISNLYDSKGRKLRSSYVTTNQNLYVPIGSTVAVSSEKVLTSTVRDYCGRIIYENNVLSKILTEEGYITLSGSTPIYHYYAQDHLGNNRVVVNQNGTIEQVTHYYAYGLPFSEGYDTSQQPYKYNGKELDRMHGLDWYDYGARFYDPALTRFHGADPKAHLMPSWSPYSFCFNNPLKFIDLTGEIPTPVEGASIAGHIYDGKIGDVLDGDWRLDKVYTNSENPAYRSGLYSRTVDGVTEYAMANAGTYFENSKRGHGSMSEDIEQPFGGSENMKVSIATAKQVSRDVGDKELTFIGHSKGGAEAAGNALATNRNALLYNPAAINAEAYGLDTKSYTGADKNGMTAFVVKGDMLNSFINQFFAKPIDKVVYLPQQSKNPVTNHLIDSMIKALQQYYKINEQK